MNSKRRNLLKILPLSFILPSQVLNSITAWASSNSNSIGNRGTSLNLIKNKIDKLYKKSIVLDGLVITRGWDEDSFDALAKSGYTGFNTSLPARQMPPSGPTSQNGTVPEQKPNRPTMVYTIA